MNTNDISAKATEKPEFTAPNDLVRTDPESAATPGGDDTACAHSVPSKPIKPSRPGIAVLAAFVTVFAWIFEPLNFWACAVGAVAALVLSILAMRQRGGGWRNLALVALVASSVLVLVLAISVAAYQYLLDM